MRPSSNGMQLTALRAAADAERSFGNRSVRGSTDPSPGARSMDLAHLVVDVGY